MEIKAELQKPYTEKQKIDFIVQYNHNLGYEIRETENSLQAWSDTEAEEFEKAKAAKHEENLKKAFEAEESGTVIFKGAKFETSGANTAKLTAQFSMLQNGIIDKVQWLSKDDQQIELDSTDIIELGSLIADYTGALWNVYYLGNKELIDAARNLNDLNEIIISY